MKFSLLLGEEPFRRTENCHTLARRAVLDGGANNMALQQPSGLCPFVPCHLPLQKALPKVWIPVLTPSCSWSLSDLTMDPPECHLLFPRCPQGAAAAGGAGSHHADVRWEPGGSADSALLPERRHLRGGEPDDSYELSCLSGPFPLPPQYSEERKLTEVGFFSTLQIAVSFVQNDAFGVPVSGFSLSIFWLHPATWETEFISGHIETVCNMVNVDWTGHRPC